MPVLSVLLVLGEPDARSKHSRLTADSYGMKMARFPEKAQLAGEWLGANFR